MSMHASGRHVRTNDTRTRTTTFGLPIAVVLVLALVVGACSTTPARDGAAPVQTGKGATEQGLDDLDPAGIAFDVLKMFGAKASGFVMSKLGLDPTQNALDAISKQIDRLDAKVDRIQESIDRLSVDVHGAELTDLLQNKLYPIRNALVAIRDDGLQPVVAASQSLVAAQDAYKADPSDANKKRVEDAKAALAAARKHFTDVANSNGVHTNLANLHDLVNPSAGHSLVNVFGRDLLDSNRLVNGSHSDMLYAFYDSLADLQAMAAWLQAEEVLNRTGDTATTTPGSQAPTDPTIACGLEPNPSEVGRIGSTLCANLTSGRNSLPPQIPNGVVIDRGPNPTDTTAGKTMLLTIDGTYTFSTFATPAGSVQATLKDINAGSGGRGLGFNDWKAASRAELQPLSLEYPVQDKDHPVMLPAGADYLNRTVFALQRTNPDRTVPGELYQTGQAVWLNDVVKQTICLDDDTVRPQQGVDTHLADTLGPDAPFRSGASTTRMQPVFPADWTDCDKTPVQAFNWQSTVAPQFTTAKARFIAFRANGGTNYFAQH